MRIAIFTNTYLPSINGVVNSIEAFRRGLEHFGHEVYVMAPASPGHHDRQPNVFRFASIPAPGQVEYPLALPYSRQVMRALREINVDLVHTHHPWWVGTWGRWYARRTKRPLITTIHTQYELYSHYVHFYQPVVKRIIRRKTLKYCGLVDCVITPGESRKRDLQSQGVTTRIEVVPNATDIEPFERADGTPVRERYNLAPDQPLLLYVGRVAPEKSLDVVLHAVRQAVQHRPDLRLLIAGDGPAREDLRALARELDIRDHVIFAGRVPYDQIPGYHAAADLFVTASLSEVQPLSVTEAMAARTPLIAVASDWNRDIVRHGENGLLARNDPRDFGAKLTQALNDETARKAMAAAASRQAQQYAIKPASQRLIEVYQTLL